MTWLRGWFQFVWPHRGERDSRRDTDLRKAVADAQKASRELQKVLREADLIARFLERGPKND